MLWSTPAPYVLKRQRRVKGPRCHHILPLSLSVTSPSSPTHPASPFIRFLVPPHQTCEGLPRGLSGCPHLPRAAFPEASCVPSPALRAGCPGPIWALSLASKKVAQLWKHKSTEERPLILPGHTPGGLSGGGDSSAANRRIDRSGDGCGEGSKDMRRGDHLCEGTKARPSPVSGNSKRCLPAEAKCVRGEVSREARAGRK